MKRNSILKIKINSLINIYSRYGVERTWKKTYPKSTFTKTYKVVNSTLALMVRSFRHERSEQTK